MKNSRPFELWDALSPVIPGVSRTDRAPKLCGGSKKQPRTRLGLAIRTRRLALGMSTDDLAAEAKVERWCVHMAEIGVRHLSNDDILERFEKALQFDPGELASIRGARKTPKARRDKFSDVRAKRTTKLGTFLSNARRTHDLSLDALAERAGLGVSAVAEIERGVRVPKTSTVKKLAKALGCEIPPEIIPPPKPGRWGSKTNKK